MPSPTTDARHLEAFDAATRREFLAMMAAAGLLAACGGGGGGTPDAGPDGDTITVTNRFGTFEVPRNPQRVVGWEGRRDLETTLALGLVPIAIGSNAFFGQDELAPFVPFDPEGVTVIEQTSPNLELIASLRPDLILTRDSNIEDLLNSLQGLAPLIPVAPDGPWRPDLEGVAADLGRGDQAAAPLAVYDERRSELRARHGERIHSAVLAVVTYFAEGRTFYASSTRGFYLQANTLADLGGNHLPFLEDNADAFNDGISLEQVEQLAGADVFVLVTDNAEDRSDLESSPLWQRLPAVEAGRVVHTDGRTNYGSVYAATACLDLLDAAYATLA